MKKYKLLLILMIILSICEMKSSNAAIRYVNVNASGSNDGTSWANAYNSLQSALNTTIDTIWVANGVYKPTNTSNRTISFVISGNKAVFGGFSGNEALLSQRNFSNYQTVLSGDIGVLGDSLDNSFHVVKFLNSVKVMDGFKISDGNADSISTSYPSALGSFGGGLNIYNGPLGLPGYTIKNCYFINNYASSGGAVGVFPSQLKIENCTFINNRSQYEGGAISLRGASAMASLTISNSLFYDNESGDGGAIYFYGTLFANRCIFSGNRASLGGALYGMGASTFSVFARIENSLIVGNSADNYAAMYSDDVLLGSVNGFRVFNSTISHNKTLNQSGTCMRLTPQSVLKNSIVWGNCNSNNTSASSQITGQINAVNMYNNTIENSALINNYNFNPSFINPGSATNAPFNAANFNYRLDSLLSPAIDTGNNADVSVTSTDLDGNPRVQNLKVDLGAYERYHCSVANAGAITANGPTSFCPGSTVTLTAPIGGFNYLWNTGSNANNITVSSSGNFTVSIADSSNCVSHLQQQVSVKPAASVSISGNNSFCENGQTTLTASGNNGGFTFMWSNGTTTASNVVNIPGPYFVVGTNSYGCSDASDTVHVQSIPLPTINVSGDTFFCENSSTILTVTGSATNYFWSNGSLGMNIAVDTPGAYYVNAINDFGCMANSDTVHVQSIPLPTINVSGDTFFCENSSTILTVTGNATNYFWSNGSLGMNIAVDTPGAYYVNAINDFGCMANSDTVHVVSIPLPVPTIAHLGDSLITGVFNSYQWIKDNVDILGATNQYYLPSVDGIYWVEVTNSEGCVGMSDPFNYTSLSIVDNNDKSINLRLYPNPVKDRLIVDISDLADKTKSFVIYDIEGKSIISHEISSNNILEVELSSVANGFYILQLNTTNKKYRLKFTIDR